MGGEGGSNGDPLSGVVMPDGGPDCLPWAYLGDGCVGSEHEENAGRGQVDQSIHAERPLRAEPLLIHAARAPP